MFVYVFAWMRGLENASFRRCVNARMVGRLDLWMHGYLDEWMFGLLDVRMYKGQYCVKFRIVA